MKPTCIGCPDAPTIVAILNLPAKKSDAFIAANAVRLFGGPCYYGRPYGVASYEALERVNGAAAIRAVLEKFIAAGVALTVIDARSPTVALPRPALTTLRASSAEFYELFGEDDPG